MPNHVMNILQYSGPIAQVQRMRTFVKSQEVIEDGTVGCDVPFSFQKIIPMPETLNIEAGSKTDDALRYYLALVQDTLQPDEQAALERARKRGGRWNRLYQPMTIEERRQFEDRITLTEQAIAMKDGATLLYNLSHYQATTWYDWRVENWGTKWGAYNQSSRTADHSQEGVGCYIFNTAWTPPIPVIRRLATIFPDITFKWRWADENYGHNLGEARFINGTVVWEKQIEEGTREAIAFAREIWGYYSPDEDSKK